MKLKNHNVFLLAFVFVHNVFGAYNAPSLNSCAAYSNLSEAERSANNGLVIKSHNVTMAEQLAPAVKNGVCLPRDLVSTDPVLNEAMRSYKNGQGDQIPTVKKEIENNPDCHELPYGKTILHDFNDQVAEACNLTPDMRATCYILAGFEHLGAIPGGTVLNVDGQHNVKFVCSNGEEFAFDKDGNFIANGINEGTFNLADPENEPVKHIFDDMLAAVQALPQKSSMTKDEFYSFLEKYVEEHKITIPLRDGKSEEKVCREDKSMSDDNPTSGGNKYSSNGHKWVMRGEQPISFDDIVLGAPWQGKKNDTSIVVLKQPYFVFHTVFVSVEDGRVRGVCFDCGRPNQRAIESMAIGELICKDIEKQCGVKLKNDKRPHHRQYQWNGRGFRRIELRINNENDDTPGNASFFLLVDGGYGYHKYVDH